MKLYQGVSFFLFFYNLSTQLFKQFLSFANYLCSSLNLLTYSSASLVASLLYLEIYSLILVACPFVLLMIYILRLNVLSTFMLRSILSERTQLPSKLLYRSTIYSNTDNLIYQSDQTNLNSFVLEFIHIYVYQTQVIVLKIINMQFKHKIKKTEEVEHKQEYKTISDQQFYSGLLRYTTCFSKVTSTPMFLHNRQSLLLTAVILVINIISLLQIISLYSSSQDSISSHFLTAILIVNAFFLFMMDVLYLLTIKLNPGIRNLTKISYEEYEQFGKEYCIYCENYKTFKMTHCQQCQVCIQDFDHHCTVLNRCVGGSQKYAFFGFIFTLGITLCSLIICGAISLVS